MHLDSRFEILSTARFAVLAPQELQGRPRVYVSSPCSYTRSIVEAAFRRRRQSFAITLNRDDADVQWADYEDLDWDVILEGKVKANSYLIRKGLSRKAQLCHYLNKHVAKHPTSVLRAAVPSSMAIETWEVYEDDMTFLGAKFDRSMVNTVSKRQRLEWSLADAKAKMEAAGGDALWILKPSVTNKGAEIFVVRDFGSLADAVSAWPDVREWVLQRYVDRPLLFRGTKFHLRVYVLAVGDLSVYVYDGILLLCSAVAYNREDISNQLSHITNTARQAESSGFVEQDCVFLLEDLATALRAEGRQDADELVRRIRQDIRAITAELFRALHGERTVFSPQPNCFELFGLDFLVGEDLQVYLLEANPGPDFKQTGDRLKAVIQGLIEATVDVALCDKDDSKLVKVYEDREKGARFHAAEGQAGAAGGGMRLFN